MTAMVSAEAPADTPRNALREPQFARYLAGSTLSEFGDMIWFVALAWSAVHLASPAAAGVLLMLSSIPRLALLMFGGVIADRFDIRRLMIGSDGLRAVLTLGAAGIALLTPGIALLVVLTLVFGTVDAVFLPSAGAMRPRLLRPGQYKSGSVAVEMTSRLALSLGAPLGGIVVALGHLPLALLVDGLTFAVSVATLVTVRPRPLPAPAPTADDQDRPGYVADLRRGFGFLARHPMLGPLTIVGLLSNLGFVGPMNIGLAELSAHRGWGAAGIGVLLTGFGIGGGASALAMSWVHIRRGAGVSMAVLGAIQGAAVLSIGLAPSVWVGALASGVAGLCTGPMSVISTVLTQEATPDELRGRVSSFTTMTTYGAVLVASSGMGVAIGAIGLTSAYALSGALEAAGLLMLVFPGLRRARIES
ncbi:MAG TPA: MFS transporter [Streptosporangiaceae bacterium]|jgi:MFS family permease|nr:MFS transporter [Streptosporangiaceae bacterium]